VFDRPAAGRAFFEQLIRDHLDVGRPESVSLIFDKRVTRRTPGTLRTKVITKGVDPQVNCYFKSSRIKQYFKEHRAPAHRDGDLQYPRLRHRSAGHRRELDSPSGGWRSRQPASVRRTSCRCPSRSGCGHLRRGDPAVHHRWPARPRAAVWGPPRDGGNGRHRRVHASACRLRQSHAGPVGQHPARPGLHQPPGHLRPAAPQTQGPHRPPRRQPPLPAHPARQACRSAVHQGLRKSPRPRARSPRPTATTRTGSTNPTRHRLAAARSHPRPIHHRRAHGDLNLKLGLTANFTAAKRS
jgi:hypothetical protein